MKLRNKKTGKIISSKELLTDEFMIDLFSKDFTYFNSILNKIEEEWEDVEEPKGYWYIRDGGNIDFNLYGKSIIERHKTIGNYFETKEEAEKAVEKLKVWKRLKDEGFRFKNWYWDNNGINGFINFSIKSANIDVKDIELLFGGEG